MTVQVPVDKLLRRMVVDGAIAVVIDAVTGIGGQRMDVPAKIITVFPLAPDVSRRIDIEAELRSETVAIRVPESPGRIVAILIALDDLEQLDGNLRELVELKFFGGLTYTEIGRIQARSERSIKRDWVKARAFLLARSESQVNQKYFSG